MRRRLPGLVMAALLVGACGGSASVESSIEAMPPIPETPTGWVLVDGMGGSGSQFSVATGIQLGGDEVALNGACRGVGSLVVVILPASGGDSGAGPSAVFPCGGTGATATNRFELTGMSIPDKATVRATVVEGAGTNRHAAFYIAIEQRQP